MKLSLNWLKDYVDLNGVKTQDIKNKLTLATCEVESFHETFTYLPHIQVAKILKVESHPNADRLSVCVVQTNKEKLNIVCGAKNVKEKMLVALAPVKTHLPKFDEKLGQNSSNEFWEVLPANIRGVKSLGMLCSSKELGIENLTKHFLENDEGILDLEAFFISLEKHYPLLKKNILNWKTLGTTLNKIFPLCDTIFEIDNKSITHRPDLWSVYGFARELSAIFKKNLKNNPFIYKIVSDKKVPKVPKKKINITQGSALAYFGVCVENIEIKPSPLWLQCRIININHNPINNVVDTSNYVMFDIGQPNHCFDLRTIKTDEISVVVVDKKSKYIQQKFTTLDGVERVLTQDSIIIYDGEIPSATNNPNALALGGVMGGEFSKISNDTTSLFIESATFPRSKIRRVTQSLGLRTDSAQRFEKGQDPAKALPGLAFLLFLLKLNNPKLRIGTVTGKIIDQVKQKIIQISYFEIENKLSLNKDPLYVKKLLERLHLKVEIKKLNKKTNKTNSTNLDDTIFIITIPSFRSQYDLSIPEDILEELGRLHGFDNIAPTPPLVTLDVPIKNQKTELIKFIKEYLAFSTHLNETYNYSFSSKENNSLFKGKPIRLTNPVFENKNEMRLSLIPGLLNQLASNQNRFQEVRLFEFGRTYEEIDSISLDTNHKIKEKNEIAIGIITPHKNESLLLQNIIELRQSLEILFKKIIPKNFLFKIADLNDNLELEKTKSKSQQSKITDKIINPNDFDASLDSFLNMNDKGEEKVSYQTNDNLTFSVYPYLHPNTQIEFSSTKLKDLNLPFASIGLLHPEWQKTFDIKKNCIIANIQFDQLFEIYTKTKNDLNYLIPSVYPELRFELSIIMPLHCSTLKPVQIIRELELYEIDQIYFLNEYFGPPLKEGQKSVSYEIICSHQDKTLNSQDEQVILKKVVSHLEKAGFPLRT